jgi:hypothetical protein
MAKQMTENSPTHAQITQRAYEIFIERGSPEGHDLDHWLEAERQLQTSATGDARAQRNVAAARPLGNGKAQSRARK